MTLPLISRPAQILAESNTGIADFTLTVAAGEFVVVRGLSGIANMTDDTNLGIVLLKISGKSIFSWTIENNPEGNTVLLVPYPIAIPVITGDTIEVLITVVGFVSAEPQVDFIVWGDIYPDGSTMP